MNDVNSRLIRLQRMSLIVAALGALLSAVALLLDADRFLHSYLFAFCYWTGASLGCMGILMLHYLTGGRWGLLIRRPLEAGALALPIMFVLILPILAFLPHIYSWSRPAAMDEPTILQKAAYLNSGFFVMRTIIYFVLWILLATLLRRWSLDTDRGDAGSIDKLSTLSAPGLLLYVLTASFAAMDWGMSLEPAWYSSIYGLIFIIGQALSGIVVCILIMRYLVETESLMQTVTAQDFNDFGNLLLVFVMLTAYMSLSQFLIIWSGNIPDEPIWYLRRAQGGWQWVAALLAAILFLAPFLILLFRSAKRNPRALAGVAVLVGAAHAVELYWLIIPAFEVNALPHLSDFAALLLLGGLWTARFVDVLKRAPLLPGHALELSVQTKEQESAI